MATMAMASCGGDDDNGSASTGTTGNTGTTSNATPAGTGTGTGSNATPSGNGTNPGTGTANATPSILAAQQELTNTFAATLSGSQTTSSTQNTIQAAGTAVVNPATRTIVATVITTGIAPSAVRIQDGPSGPAGIGANSSTTSTGATTTTTGSATTSTIAAGTGTTGATGTGTGSTGTGTSTTGTNGATLFALTEAHPGSGVWGISATLTEAQLASLQAGNLYVIVSGTSLPNGELQGQLISRAPTGTGGATTTGTSSSTTGGSTTSTGATSTTTGSSTTSTAASGTTGFTVGTPSGTGTATATSPANGVTTPSVFLSALRGSQETPPNASAALGAGTVLVDVANRMLIAAVETAGITGTDAHIHLGAPGVSGPIVFPLTKAASGNASGNLWYTRVSLTDAQIASTQAGDYYLNVHSTAFPLGEIRGQVLPLQTNSGTGSTTTSTGATTTTTGTGTTSTALIATPAGTGTIGNNGTGIFTPVTTASTSTTSTSTTTASSTTSTTMIGTPAGTGTTGAGTTGTGTTGTGSTTGTAALGA